MHTLYFEIPYSKVPIRIKCAPIIDQHQLPNLSNRCTSGKANIQETKMKREVTRRFSRL